MLLTFLAYKIFFQFEDIRLYLRIGCLVTQKRKYEKFEEIKKPEEYYEIISRYSTILKVSEDVKIFVWKKAIANVDKPTSSWHFSSAQSKRIIAKEVGKSIQVCGEAAYKSDFGADKSICKRGKKIGDTIPILKKQNVIKEEKLLQSLLILKAIVIKSGEMTMTQNFSSFQMKKKTILRKMNQTKKLFANVLIKDPS